MDNSGILDKFINTHMKTAEIYASHSRSRRSKVGAVLVDENNERILMCGYNGTPPSGDNNCEYVNNDGELVTKPEVVHAEENVILFCAKKGIKTENKILYTTLSPCFQCAKMIITSGIKKVVFKELYRDESGLNLLKQYGVEIIHIKDDYEYWWL